MGFFRLTVSQNSQLHKVKKSLLAQKPTCSLTNILNKLCCKDKNSDWTQSWFSYTGNLLPNMLPIGTTPHRGKPVIFLYTFPIECYPGVPQMTQKERIVLLFCYIPLNLNSEPIRGNVCGLHIWCS